jgi:hypothetical protein
MNPNPYDTALHGKAFSLGDAIQTRLWDLSVQCHLLLDRGQFDLVRLLQAEGEALAQAYENQETFLVTHFNRNES